MDISVHCWADDDECTAGSDEKKDNFCTNVIQVMEISVLCLCCSLNLNYFSPFERLKTCSTEG